MAEFTGKTIDRYNLIRLLGKGGMAVVYLAFDTRLERYVAIKFIHAEVLDQDIFLKRFEREARALASLSHPNIVKVLDFGRHENLPYIVMEYIPGGTLRERLGKPMRPSQAARIILPIARALDYTHRKGIIHRDVKPANFLIMENGEPMLSDFGIARIMEESDTGRLTGTGTGIGTPEYMSPEQCRGDRVDPRTDVYSLGIVLYELLTGVKPFTADTPIAVLMKHCQETLPSPTLFVPDLPIEVGQILDKALAKNPANRYQSMGQLTTALEKIVEKDHQAPQVQTVKKPPAEPPRQAEAWRSPESPVYTDPVAMQKPARQTTAQSPLPAPVYNYPAAAPEPVKAPVDRMKSPPSRRRSSLWIGGALLGVVLCIALVVALYIGGNLFSDQRNAAVTATAQSLEATLLVHHTLQTAEAARETAAVLEVLAQNTREAQDATATAAAEEEAHLNTQTAEAQAATQQALDAAVQAFEDARENWTVDFQADFNPGEGWETGEYTSEWWEGSKTISGGYFTWEMTAFKGFYHYMTGSNTQYRNFLVTMVGGETVGNENGETGLVLMQSDAGKYYFTLNNHQLWYAFYRYSDGEWTTLAYGDAPIIRTGEMNTIAIQAEEGVFTIFINGAFIAQVTDTVLDQGEIGIAAGLSNADEQATFQFDSLTIQVP